jgi:DNA-nicking Smr family endonuclease
VNDPPPVHVPIERELDLHSFAPRDIPDVVAEYLEAAWERGFARVRLVHGRGIGVQRAVVHRLLAGHPRVKQYFDAPESHLGATVVELVRSEP